MNSSKVVRKRSLRLLLGDAEDPIDLVGPVQSITSPIKLPMAHVSDPLRLSKAGLALAQRLLSLLALPYEGAFNLLLLLEDSVASPLEKTRCNLGQQHRQSRPQLDDLIERKILKEPAMEHLYRLA